MIGDPRGSRLVPDHCPRASVCRADQIWIAWLIAGAFLTTLKAILHTNRLSGLTSILQRNHLAAWIGQAWLRLQRNIGNVKLHTQALARRIQPAACLLGKWRSDHYLDVRSLTIVFRSIAIRETNPRVESSNLIIGSIVGVYSIRHFDLANCWHLAVGYFSRRGLGGYSESCGGVDLDEFPYRLW